MAKHLSLVFALLCAGCASYRPSDSTVGNMSVNKARRVVVALEGKQCNEDPCGGYFMKGGRGSITGVRVLSDKLIMTAGGKDHVFMLEEISRIATTSARSVAFTGARIVVYSGDPTEVAMALYVLEQNAIAQKKAADEFDAIFSASLPDYRKMAAANAKLPGEADKFKAQAEGAVLDKEFNSAADLYAEGLKFAPWWPAGHFNRALVLGELKDYAAARREMGYYLQLVPDAENARDARNKMYDWERLEAQ